jgi:hypothetical protein
VPSHSRRRFIEAIKEYFDQLETSSINFVFAVRQDVFGKFQEEFEAILPTFLNDCARINVTPLTTQLAREAIVKPLSNLEVKIVYEDELVEQLLVDL